MNINYKRPPRHKLEISDLKLIRRAKMLAARELHTLLYITEQALKEYLLKNNA